MPRKIGFIHSGSFYHLACLKDPFLHSFELVDLYLPEIEEKDIFACDSILIAGREHRGQFERIIPFIIKFLATPGKKLYVDGANDVGSWLPGTREEERPTNFWAWRTGEDTLRRNVNTDHWMWEYLNDDSVHWHFHGALFPPEGAVPLVILEEENVNPFGSIIYYDDQTFEADILVSTMDSCYHHGSGFMPGATQLLYRSIRWLSKD
ncbi:MAG: hypothetical protein J6M18_05455 [Actinomycetaceae bacterium]|nr:hypothetical protein [Actinomycetaceae bacterium]